MDVDLGAALAMAERRNLVHPDTVVTVVVGVDLSLEPAALDEPFLDLADPLLRHQQIDIGEDASACRRQPCQEIACAFEQDQRYLDTLERPEDPVHLPGHQRLPMFDDVAGGPQMRRGASRDAAEQAQPGELRLQSAEQPDAPGDAQEQLPVGRRQGGQLFGRLQGSQQQPVRAPCGVDNFRHRWRGKARRARRPPRRGRNSSASNNRNCPPGRRRAERPFHRAPRS